MYEIEYTPQAIEDLKYFKKHEQQQICLGEIPVQLRYEPSVETRNRKRTRPNSMAAWELRIAEFRVFYSDRKWFVNHRACIMRYVNLSRS